MSHKWSRFGGASLLVVAQAPLIWLGVIAVLFALTTATLGWIALS